MKKILLFLIIAFTTYSVQTHKHIDSAEVTIKVNVFVISNPQQLTIVNEQGIQQDSIVINHFVSPDFMGEDISQETFYVQRGAGEQGQVNLSSGVLEVTLNRNEMQLIGSQTDALDTELVVERPQAVVIDGTNRIENRVTSRIIKRPNTTLNPNEQYSGDTNMTVIWRKE